ncbi:AraC family transcriptional regulator [uncultured Methylobacterium sp.]|jgi:AraC-like DNA-binding protein|uniref:AraC family transcriptional regulator n=1 Tax=uncultured Methylobacterium sp. TaxID=157278 RepID=UPI002623571A|nr:AraC family transcriptional regulator [uncultured Methylobacterium sp.]
MILVDAPAAAPPMSDGTLTRLAARRLADAGLSARALMRQAGLSPAAIEHPDLVPAAQQAGFLDLAAQALGDDLLGLHLALAADGREFGPFHYLVASCADLGEALAKQARYLPTVNRGLVCTLERAPGVVSLDFALAGVERHRSNQEIEFWVAYLLRQARQFTTLELIPARVAFLHEHLGDSAGMTAYLRREPVFRAERDSLAFDDQVCALPLMAADPYLNDFLTRFHEDLLRHGVSSSGALASRVANALTPLLAHGHADVTSVANALGMSTRTLGRRLAEEGISFRSILEQIRADLALRYVRDTTMPISQIAWRLGYRDPSAFIVAFKRWTGKPPSAVRRERRG